MQDEYITVKGQAEAGFVEKKSEFIGQICHVENADQAIEFIGLIRAKHRKARHNVYAYITRDGSTTRYSDDGEPQGTGGTPVLDVLMKEGLTDVCVVVTRSGQSACSAAIMACTLLPCSSVMLKPISLSSF